MVLTSPHEPPSLLNLCDELLLHIFTFLDVPELLSASRTCHRLRPISVDPLLHRSRLHHASNRLSESLAVRPSLSSLQPPTSSIYLTGTHQAARLLSRRLIATRLNRSLSRRPSASDLVGCNILPSECCAHDKATGQIVWGASWGVVVAPGLVDARRKVEREKIKDRLRHWLAHRLQQQQQHQQYQDRPRGRGKRGRKSRSSSPYDSGWTGYRAGQGPSHVRSLVHRFARSSKLSSSSSSSVAAGKTSVEGGGRGGGSGGGTDGHLSSAAAPAYRPPRAHVSRMRSFWERVGSEGGIHDAASSRMLHA